MKNKLDRLTLIYIKQLFDVQSDASTKCLGHLRLVDTLNDSENDSKVSIPFRCPICGGNGIVAPGFYMSTSGHTTSNAASEQCRACSGTGIIWS